MTVFSWFQEFSLIILFIVSFLRFPQYSVVYFLSLCELKLSCPFWVEKGRKMFKTSEIIIQASVKKDATDLVMWWCCSMLQPDDLLLLLLQTDGSVLNLRTLDLWFELKTDVNPLCCLGSLYLRTFQGGIQVLVQMHKKRFFQVKKYRHTIGAWTKNMEPSKVPGQDAFCMSLSSCSLFSFRSKPVEAAARRW